MELSQAAIDLMLAAAARSAPVEACGVIINGEVFELPNISNQPTSFFLMDTRALERLYYDVGDFEAVWHSHPGGSPKPSTSDLEHHPADLTMLIVADGKVHDHGRPGA